MWEVLTTDIFDDWYDSLDETNRARMMALLLVLAEKGPALARPYADTLEGSAYSNMKELRIQSKGDPLRAFFAFDPKRQAIVLCAGNKAGDEKRFYKKMIPIADREFTAHLSKIKEQD